MDCILLAGLYWLIGTDYDQNRYMIQIDTITNIVQEMSISDQQNDMRPMTRIMTTNGMVIEDHPIIEVVRGIAICEEYWINDPNVEQE